MSVIARTSKLALGPCLAAMLGVLGPGATGCASDPTRAEAIDSELSRESCVGSCGGRAPAGCGCDDACRERRDCCPNQGAVCSSPPRPTTLPEWPPAQAKLDHALANAGCRLRELRTTRLSICYDDSLRLARWVGHELEPNDYVGLEPARTDDFREDPAVPPLFQATLDHYRSSGMQRGHLAPAGDFRADRRALSESFLLSNIVPQTRDNNLTIWLGIERWVRDRAEKTRHAWIMTGTLFVDSAGQPTAPLGWIGQGKLNIRDRGVAVPTHLFKAVLVEDRDGRRHAYAFVAPNARGDFGDAIEHYQVPVDHVEAWLGADFFAALPDAEELALERAKESIAPWL